MIQNSTETRMSIEKHKYSLRIAGTDCKREKILVRDLLLQLISGTQYKHTLKKLQQQKYDLSKNNK